MTPTAPTVTLPRSDFPAARLDSPLRRLLQHGAAPLSDAELVGLLVGGGDASARAERLLESFGALETLLSEAPAVLEHHPDAGPQAAGALLAAAELGRRIRRSPAARPRLTNARDIYRHVAADLERLPREVFHVLCFDARSTLLRNERIAEGSVDQCTVDPREVFRVALATRATAIVLLHNHPTGNPTPSSLDHLLTQQLVEGSRFLSIRVLDHIIVGRDRFYSMCETGTLPSATRTAPQSSGT